jgi:hypothetical protein
MDDIKDRQYNDNYDDLRKQYQLYPYQARFLRALFYFRLIKRYGSVPYITQVLTPEEANKVEPSTYEAVTDSIV